MARKMGVALDMLKSEIQNVTIQNLATAPASPATGQIYFDTVLGYFGIYSGSSWIYLLDSEGLQDLIGQMVSGNTETGIAVTYDDSAGKLNFVVAPLNGIPTPTADVALGGFKITGLADGVSNSDAATFGQVVAAQNGMDWKASVRVATTSAGTLATSFENGDTIDGVVLATGDRILIKDQASGSENGVYTVNASGAPTRATDADANAEVTAGFSVFVSEGSANGNTTWTLTTNDAIVVGTTALTFAQTSRVDYVFDGGLIAVGNQVGVNYDGSTIQQNGGSGLLEVVPGVYTKKYAATIGDGASTSFNVDHNLNTRDVTVEVYDTATYAEITTAVVHSTVNRVVVTFDVAPTNNQYRVVVVG